MNEIISKLKAEIDKAIDHLQHELSSLRTGRANAGLLASVLVDSYGTKMPLTQVASVSVSDAKTLVISPWDKGQIQAIEKGIQAANLGLSPSNDGLVVRIILPPMNEERRKELVKLVSNLGEHAKIAIRQNRESAIKQSKNAEVFTDDETKALQKKIQDAIDLGNANVKSICEAKEKEVMTV